MGSSSMFLAGLAGAAALVAGTAASAAIYAVTVGGTVISGVDETGVFGVPGDLAGEAFTAVFTYDTAGSRDTDPGVRDEIYPITASLRINGVTHVLPTTDLVASAIIAKPGELQFEHFSSVDADPVEQHMISLFALSAGIQPDLDTPFSGPADGGGSFNIFACCCPSCSPRFQDVSAGGWLDVNYVRYPVPEPASWALAIVGFGMAGAALRRRRLVAA